MKIWAALGLITESHVSEAKRASGKGRLAVSHRNMFRSELPLEKPGKADTMPDFIINGVNKCGTTAASFFLEKHSKLQKAHVETNFFNTDDNYSRGFGWYSEQFPEPQEGKLMYEKTPAYYKSHVAPERIKFAKPDIKLITVVCDNVHRTLSRYLHIQKHAPQKMKTLGYSLQEFNDGLRDAVPVFMKFLDEVKQNEGDNTLEGLIQALTYRLQNNLRPFNLKESSHFEMILSDGIYAVHQQAWRDEFGDDQLLVVNGNNFLNSPWVPMRKIQSFLGLENEISRDSFIIPKNEDGSDGTPCYIEDDQTEANCIGKGSSEKGRSLDKNFSLDVAKMLHELFEPFDNYFAHRVLQRQSFDWRFGLE